MRSLKTIGKRNVPGALLVTLASAALFVPQASAHDACTATRQDSGSSCVSINNETEGVHSWRNPDNGDQCLANSELNKTIYYQSRVRLVNPMPRLVPYADTDCGTRFMGKVRQEIKMQTSDNYIIYHML
jgi:hypothetical protein